jgi:Copper transport outer membrane protein, MctB
MGAPAAVIDFRYHIVSLIAVFLALALGLFLGSTTLQSTVTHNLHNQANSVLKSNHNLRTVNQQLNGQIRNEEAFIDAMSPYSLENRLSGDTVVVVSAPGVSGDDRKGLIKQLQIAGGVVSGDVQLQSSFLDPSQDAELGALATRFKLSGHPLPIGNGAAQAASQLAAVLAVRPGQVAVRSAAISRTLSVLSDGNFIKVSGALPNHPADLAVLLVPAPSPTTASAQALAQDKILLTLARYLRANTNGVVIAGPVPVPLVSGGAIDAAHNDHALSKTVSTVEVSASGVDPIVGQVAIVLTLADATTGTPGAYGLGKNPPLPVASPTP